MLKKWLFHIILWLPMLGVIAVAYYFVFQTNAPQHAYLNFVRDINYGCFQMAEESYAYKLKPGTCSLNNIEYRTTQQIDANGFRNPDETFYQADTVAIGDSHTFGLGVNDEATLSRQLTDHHGIKTLSLGVPTYSTFRELETLRQYAPYAKNVILQYCDNDFEENRAYLANPKDHFKAAEDDVRQSIREALDVYNATKNKTLWDEMRGIAQTLSTHDYANREAAKAAVINRGQLPTEATAFAQILATHRDLLLGKHIVVFESSSYGWNSPNFQSIFETALHQQLPELDITVLNSTHVVNHRDYYFLDDHPRPSAFRKLAAALAPQLLSHSAPG